MNNQESTKTNWFDRQANSFETSRFGAMAVLMTAQSCLGSVAAMFALKIDSYELLTICAVVTMASNSLFIAQSTAKWCLATFYISVVANLFVLAYGVIASI